jgi:hypothetical protein
MQSLAQARTDGALPHSRLKSLHSGLTETISAIFLTPQPSLDALLPFKRIPYIFKPLEIDEPVESILRRKGGPDSRLVLSHSLDKAIRHACVKCFRSIRHDVNKVRFRRMRLHRSFASLRMTKPGEYGDRDLELRDATHEHLFLASSILALNCYLAVILSEGPMQSNC